MKKAILMFVILFQVMSLFGCKSAKSNEHADIPQSDQIEQSIAIDTDNMSADTEALNDIKDDAATKPNENTDTEASKPSQPEVIVGEIKIDVPPPTEINTVQEMVDNYSAADVFIGKIISVKEIIPDNPIYTSHKHNDAIKICDSYFRLNENIPSELFLIDSKIYQYTVEVKKCISPVFTQEKTTITVIDDVQYNAKAYTAGQSYLMYGTLFEYKDKTVLRLWKIFAATVNEKGELQGLSRDAKAIESIGTVDNLIANTTVRNFFKNDITIPPEFMQSYGVPENELVTAEKNKAILDKIIADGKKAIIADSDFKMAISTQTEVK